jgi:glutamate racemase
LLHGSGANTPKKMLERVMETWSDNSAPIGVFDSGVGGLSILRAIREELPAESLVYVGDSANAPYGDQTSEYIIKRVLSIGLQLTDLGVKAIVVACNTATVVAAESLRSLVRVPIIAMEPAIKPAVHLSRTGIVGVIATTRTLESASVRRLCDRYSLRAKIELQACPGVVEYIEQGNVREKGLEKLLESYVKPLLKSGADTLVLGCTHYALVRQLIAEIVGPDVIVVDSATAIAREVRRRLGDGLLRAGTETPGSEIFFSSAPREEANRIISKLWGRDVCVEPEFLPARVIRNFMI